MTDYDLGRAKGKIVIDVDRRGIRRAEGALEDLEKSAGKAAESFDDAEASTRKFERRTGKTKKPVQELADKTEKLSVQTERLVEHTEDATVAFHRLGVTSEKVVEKNKELHKVTEDLTKAERDLDKMVNDSRVAREEVIKQEERVRRLRQEQRKVARDAVDAEREVERQNRRTLESVRDVNRALEETPKRNKIAMELDNRPALRSIASVHKNLRATRALARGTLFGFAGTQGIGALGGLAGLLGGGVTSWGAQGIFGIGSAISDMSGALGLLPGAVGAALTGFTALKVGTIGLGDALDAAASGDVKKLAESLKDLSPAAQSFAVELYDIMPMLKGFKNVIQEALMDPLVGVQRELANNLLPILEGPLAQIGNIFGRTGRSLADWLMTPEQQRAMQEFLADATTGFEKLFEGAIPFANALSDIMVVSGSFLPQMGESLAEMAREFADFIRTAKDNGEFAAWIQEGIESVKQFGRATRDIFMGLVYMGRVSNEYGAGFLDFFEKIGSTFREWTQSVDGQDALHNFFSRAREAADALLPILKTFGTTIMNLFSGLASLGVEIAPGLNFFFNSLDVFIRRLMGALLESAPAINGFLTAFGIILVDIIEQVGPHLPKLLEALTELFYKLGLTVGPVLGAITLGLGKIAGAIDGWLNGVIEQVSGLVDALVIGFETGDWSTLKKWFVDNLRPIGATIIRIIAEALLEQANMLIGAGMTLLGKFKDAVIDKLDEWIPDFARVAKEAGGSIVENLVKGMIDGIPIIGPVLSRIAKMLPDWLKPGSPTKKGPMSKTWPEQWGKKAVRLYAEGMMSAQGAVAGAATTTANAVIGGMGQYGRNGEHALAAMVKDLLDMTGLARQFVDLFDKMSGGIFDALKFFTTDLKTGESIIPRKWARTMTDADMRRRREDAEFRQSRKDDDGEREAIAAIDRVRGGPDPNKRGDGFKSKNPINKDSSKQDIADYIYQSALANGYSKSEARAFVVQAVGESGLNPKAFGKNSGDASGGASGIFQFTPGTWKDFGKGGDPLDPIDNIEAYFRLAEARDPGSGDIKSRLAAISGGGPAHPANSGHWETALRESQQYIEGLSGSAKEAKKSLDTVASGPRANLKQDRAPYGLAGSTNTGGYGTGDGKTFPPWVIQLAEAFNLRPSTYGGHQTSNRDEPGYAPNPRGENRGIDWVGSIEDMQRFADYLSTIPEALEQVIWENPQTGQRVGVAGGRPNVGYYPSDTYGEHQNHVHTRQSQSIPLPAEAYANLSPYDRIQALAAMEEDTKKTATYNEQILEELRGQSPMLDSALQIGRDPNASDAQIAATLSAIDQNIAILREQDTPLARAQISALEDIQGQIASERGFGVVDGPIDTAESIANGMSSVVKDVLGVVDGVINSIGSASEMSDTLVRGIKNTEDIYRLIDNVQVFIDLAARVAGAVSSVTGTVAGLVGAGGAEPSGGASAAASALQGVSAIAGIVQTALETVNAAIDLGQEAYRIASKYVARFMAFWIGGEAGSLFGDIKFLLDETDGTLKAWSDENPDEKRSSRIPGFLQTDSQTSGGKIRDLNVYVGPGSDPAESLNQAMWLVQTDRGGVFSSEF